MSGSELVPALVAALLAVEWAAWADSGETFCPLCRANDPNDERIMNFRRDDARRAACGPGFPTTSERLAEIEKGARHDPDCAIHTALILAGLPDQASRNAARQALCTVAT